MKLQVGVKALITNDEGQFLFVKRQEVLPDGTGIRWDIPGGRIELEEELLVALAREVAEETELEIMGEPKLLAAQDIMIFEIDLHVVRLTYLVSAQGHVHLGDEHQAFAWRSPVEALKLETDPYLHRVLETL